MYLQLHVHVYAIASTWTIKLLNVLESEELRVKGSRWQVQHGLLTAERFSFLLVFDGLLTFYQKSRQTLLSLKENFVYLQRKKVPKDRYSISIMTKKQALQLFEQRKVRTVWDDEKEKWYFSIVDVCGILTDQPDYDHARNYWKVLKHRLVKEGNETVTNCNQLKLQAFDGKMRLTDVADTEQLFRLIQSIPSPKAEPFKQWMAQSQVSDSTKCKTPN